MTASACAALAVWLLVGPPPLRRLRALTGRGVRRRPSPQPLAMLAIGVATVAIFGWQIGLLAAVPSALLVRRLVGGLESAEAGTPGSGAPAGGGPDGRCDGRGPTAGGCVRDGG